MICNTSVLSYTNVVSEQMKPVSQGTTALINRNTSDWYLCLAWRLRGCGSDWRGYNGARRAEMSKSNNNKNKAKFSVNSQGRLCVRRGGESFLVIGGPFLTVI